MATKLDSGNFKHSKCRLCNDGLIVSFLDLGELYLTGIFPDPNELVEKSPLDLGKCDSCGLVQLLHSIPTSELYGPGYGYESNLNNSMKTHLRTTATYLEKRFELSISDTVLDIASNDGTFLSGYSISQLNLFGIDPLINYLNDHYPDSALKIPDFFSAKAFQNLSNNLCKLITSFSVFYDLDKPVDFANDISRILTEDGVWVAEQSYLPSMFNTLGFDTICHEHLLYLTLSDFKRIADEAHLKIFDVKINEINGGSFQVFMCKENNTKYSVNPFVLWLLDWEQSSGAISLDNCKEFANNVRTYKDNFFALLNSYKNNGYLIYGLGASTKGNVLLQYCKLSNLITAIGEINPKKFGKVTPGSKIPIVNQSEILNSDRMDNSKVLAVILPWHFKSSIKPSANMFIQKGGSLLIPLPNPALI